VRSSSFAMHVRFLFAEMPRIGRLVASWR